MRGIVKKALLTTQQTRLLNIWKRAARHAVYLPPSACNHDRGWYHLDINLAICQCCQHVHSCNECTCATWISDEGFHICKVTACCVRNLAHGKDEYVETVSRMPSDKTAKPLNATMKMAQSADVIYTYCIEMLDGAKWKHCMEQESQRIDDRRISSFIRAVKEYKLKKDNVYPSIYEAVCQMMTQTKNMRSQVLMNREDRVELAMWCARTIASHICILNNLSVHSVPENKLRQSVVGLLYLMRSGVIFHDTVVLPRCDKLTAVLPLEGYLEGTFHVRGKCITEMENIVKGVFRSSRRSDLLNLGLYTVSSLL
jgi:hypothetical protein